MSLAETHRGMRLDPPRGLSTTHGTTHGSSTGADGNKSICFKRNRMQTANPSGLLILRGLRGMNPSN